MDTRSGRRSDSMSSDSGTRAEDTHADTLSQQCQHPLPSGAVSEVDAVTPCERTRSSTCRQAAATTTTAATKACNDADEKQQKQQQNQSTCNAAAALPDVPDGGLGAWMNCAGGAVAFMCSFGIVNAYGVFQDYYRKTRLSNENESIVALIGAIQLFILYGLAPLVGKVFDSYGAIPLIPIGSFCIVFGLMMVSLAQDGQTYQYFLAQAVVFGAGCAMVFTPGLALMAHHFRRLRALSIGFVAAGSSLGGVLFPIILQRLIPRVGFPWAVRTVAFISLGCLAFSCATMRTRLPLRKTTRAQLLRAVDLGGFRDVRYCLAAISAFIVFYAIFIPYFYIQQYAQVRGMDANLASYLLPMMNAFGIPARTIPGLFAPRFGVLNLMIFFTSIAGIMILALWLPSSNNSSIIAFSCLYGFFCGPFISLLPAYVGIISPQPVYGARLGALYLVVAVACLVGTPTGGALVGQTADLTHYRHLIGFSGALLLAGVIVLVLIWIIEARMMLKRRKQFINDDQSSSRKAAEPIAKPLRLQDFCF